MIHFLPPPRELSFFIAAAIVLLAIPGPAVLYIVARSADLGRKAGLASSSGIAAGGLVHVLGAAAGLSALLMSSALAFSAVKYAGAVYLIWMGIKKLRERPAVSRDALPAQCLPLHTVFRQGIVIQVLNPKTAIFFFAFLPQFVDPARGSVTIQLLSLGLLFTAMGLLTDSLWALAAGSAAGWLRQKPQFQRHQKNVSGTVYIALGLATAASGSTHK